MKRRLIRHAPIALLCAFAVFTVLNVAAWYNLRGFRNVCRRQDNTRDSLRILSQQIEAYREELDGFPKSLSDIPDVHQSWRYPEGPPTDEWRTQIIYASNETGFTLRSLGRDRSPGGVGLDADIDVRDLKSDVALATFSQFFTEGDSSEVDRSGFTTAGLITAIIVFIAAFNILGDADKEERELRPIPLVGYGLVIVVIASIVGAILMLLHIPSGH